MKQSGKGSQLLTSLLMNGILNKVILYLYWPHPQTVNFFRGTSGKQRPSLQELIDLLAEGELYQVCHILTLGHIFIRLYSFHTAFFYE